VNVLGRTWIVAVNTGKLFKSASIRDLFSSSHLVHYLFPVPHDGLLPVSTFPGCAGVQLGSCVFD
jgi:hypothetical protein